MMASVQFLRELLCASLVKNEDNPRIQPQAWPGAAALSAQSSQGKSTLPAPRTQHPMVLGREQRMPGANKGIRVVLSKISHAMGK